MLFRGCKRLLWLAPMDARAGDETHFVIRTRLPLVLRTAQNVYTVVGDCYLHGMMDGEAHANLEEFKPTDMY